MTTAVVPLHAPVRTEWLARRSEAVIEPELEIVDAHHHLWDRPDSRYLLPELLFDLEDGHRILQTVFVQSRSMYRADGPNLYRPVGEVEFANGVAAMSASGLYGETRACAAIVGCADLSLGEGVRPVISALKAAGNGRLRGIRFPVAYHDDNRVLSTPAVSPPGLMVESAFQAAASVLAEEGLSLDIWAYHTQLEEVAGLARHVPQLTIVVDHCGGVIGVGPYAGQREAAFAAWVSAIRPLAGLPNVHLKIGGLGMRVAGFHFEDGELPPSSEELAMAWRPYVETCIELFGPQRCMFESNFPVDKGAVGYRSLWNSFKRLTAHYSSSERGALFAGTARRVYKLG